MTYYTGNSPNPIAMALTPHTIDPAQSVLTGVTRAASVGGLAGYANRIPHGVLCNDGSVRLHAEIRQTSLFDYATSGIIAVTSGNAGQSVGIASEFLRHATYQSGVAWMNILPPCVNPVTGRLHQIYFRSANGTGGVPAANADVTVWWKYSDDNGVSWSGAVEITTQAKGANDWGWYGGAGNACYGTVGGNAGKIFFPVNHRTTPDTSGTPRAHVLILSNDGANGATDFALGGEVATDQTTEWSIAELASGTLVGNLRSETVNQRHYTASADSGATWSAAVSLNGVTTVSGTTTTNLVSASNCASMVKGSDGSLYLAYTNNTTDTGGDNGRCRLTIAKSSNGYVWTNLKVLDYGRCGYSSLVALSGGRFVCFYEKTVAYDAAGNNGLADSTQYIAMAGFDTTWLNDGLPAVFDYQFNEASSGAVSTIGAQLISQNRDARGRGGAGGTFSSTGLVCSGSAIAAVLQPLQAGTGALGGALDPGTGSLTIEMEVVVPAANQSGTTLLSSKSTLGMTIGFSTVGSVNKLRMISTGTGGTVTITDATASRVNDGNPHTIAMVIDQGVAQRLYMYVDGALITSNGTTTT